MGFTFEEFPDADYYRSDLRAILRYVREINKYIGTWDETVKELEEAIANLDEYGEEILALQDAINRLEPVVNKLRSDVSFILDSLTEIGNWRELTDAKMIILSNRIDRLRVYVDDMDNTIMADYNAKFYLYNLKLNQMKQQLMSYITGIIERMEYIITHLTTDVRDPITDMRIDFDTNNMLVYDRMLYGCITESEFQEIGMTETAFESIGFTQMQFSTDSARLLRVGHIYAPISGLRKSHSQAIAEVVTWFCGTMTETEFETLNLTEEEFEALNLTHEDYLKYNSSRGGVVVDPEGLGLTETQYEHLTV